ASCLVEHGLDHEKSRSIDKASLAVERHRRQPLLQWANLLEFRFNQPAPVGVSQPPHLVLLRPPDRQIVAVKRLRPQPGRGLDPSSRRVNHPSRHIAEKNLGNSDSLRRCEYSTPSRKLLAAGRSTQPTIFRHEKAIGTYCDDRPVLRFNDHS